MPSFITVTNQQLFSKGIITKPYHILYGRIMNTKQCTSLAFSRQEKIRIRDAFFVVYNKCDAWKHLSPEWRKEKGMILYDSYVCGSCLELIHIHNTALMCQNVLILKFLFGNILKTFYVSKTGCFSQWAWHGHLRPIAVRQEFTII